MAFETFADWFAMGGYALYVWPAFSICAAILGSNLLLPYWRQKHVIKDILRAHKRQARRAAKVTAFNQVEDAS